MNETSEHVCRQCGGRLSKRAAQCPHCGDPRGLVLPADPRLEAMVPLARKHGAYRGVRQSLNLILVLEGLGIGLAAFHFFPRHVPQLEAWLTITLLGLAGLIVLCSAVVVWGLSHALLDIADSCWRNDIAGAPHLIERLPF